MYVADFYESTFTESRDWEGDFSGNFLRVENEISEEKESWDLLGLLNLQECSSD